MHVPNATSQSDLNPRPLTFMSLYSGAGGLDLGFARAGCTPIFASDVNPHAVATYNRLHQVRDPAWIDAAHQFRGHTAMCGDVDDALPQLDGISADLVIGGPPCQGFSVAGRMDPDDPRSRHVFTFLQAVASVRPRAFVMENVAALAQHRRWDHVIQALQETARSLGYAVNLLVLNAADWGVPQRRERMFLIGTPLDGPAFAMPAPPTREHPLTVRSTISQLPRAGEPGNDALCRAIITLAKRPEPRPSPYAGILFNGKGRVMNLDAPAPTIPASMGGNGTPIIDERDLAGTGDPWILEYHRRLTIDGLPPLRSLPPTASLRRITVQEAAALQTFPSDAPWQGSQTARYRQIGNAVPPRLAYAVATALVNAVCRP